MKRSLIILCLFANVGSFAQRNEQFQKVDTTNLDLKAFAQNITGPETDDYERAKKLLNWLSLNFEWKATDYKTRTVKEIIARNGGNCFELAKVYMALIKEAGIQYRSICEINIHPLTPHRQATASKMTRERGFRYSVFGLQHNDHRWVEIYDKKNDQWHPADPSMGVIGLTDWLKARVWFGERKTIDTAFTNQMIVPFAIFVTNANSAPEESRTTYYLVDKFDELYKGSLSSLPEWKDWQAAVAALTNAAKNAFLNKENLHLYQDRISHLAEVYENLRKAFMNGH